jgi:tRNA pseudouridine synthase 10
LQGNYIKTQRGLPQKQKSCTNCSGKGCRICHFHGIAEFDSIEGKISHYLFSKFGGTTTKFTWIGGEDKSSLVLGSGRPFFVKILNPIKQRTRISKKINFDSIVIYNCKIISELPKKLPNFTSLIKLQISTQDEIDSKILRKLKQILRKSVIVYEKSGKRSEKVISNLKYKITSKHGFTLTIRAQGGLPVKRFVASDNVSLGISQILNTSCSCREFDFLNIELE